MTITSINSDIKDSLQPLGPLRITDRRDISVTLTVVTGVFVPFFKRTLGAVQR